MATAVVSGRVDERVKQQVDVILREAGVTVAGVIGAVWQSIAATGELPEAVTSGMSGGASGDTLSAFMAWTQSLPPQNPLYAGLTDDEILALRASDHGGERP